MRVYISADLEGVNGVVRSEHVFPTENAYAQAREWMLQEVNAAIEGAVAGGATEIVVNDSHHNMTNLLVDRFHPKATLISGGCKPMSMVQGLDSSFDAVFFLGYHAKTGTEGAVLDHTFVASLIHEVYVNDISVGEFGLNAGVAGHFEVPVVLVTGDQALVNEAKALIENIEAVTVKEGISRYAARCYPFEKTLEDIDVMARRALRQLEEKAAFKFDEPFELRIEFQRAEHADAACFIPGMVRQSGYGVSYQAEDYLSLYKAFLVALRVCA